MKAVVLAYSQIGCIGLQSVIESAFNVAALFTHKDNLQESIWFDSTAELAAQHEIPVYAPEDINHFLWLKKIKEIQPDILFSFYYRNMLSKELLSIPKKGGLNLHGSLLPKYRGRCPLNWVLINGEKESGVTLHQMTEKPDNGAIFGQEKVIITEDDTAFSLQQKLSTASKKLLTEVLPKIKTGNAKSLPQDDNKASYFGGRTPADGEINWHHSAEDIYNLVRAVTRPWPGAFSLLGKHKFFFWKVKKEGGYLGNEPAGTIISTNPLKITCGKGEKRGIIQLLFGQHEDGLYSAASQLTAEYNLTTGMRFSGKQRIKSKSKKRVLILGVNGFIGNHLSERLLASGKYNVYGMDLYSDTITRLLDNPDFHFTEGDIAIQREWIEYHVRKCDIVLPLVAIATPIEYVRNPLKVFQLDFEENLRIVRYCAKYGKRLIFPSTSEVYGMCQDESFHEQHSNFVLGPIHKQRWIYSCSKQMLDRVIWAYGQECQECGTSQGLEFTLFRPFNWIGPRLDSLESARIGSSRVITQFILNLVEGSAIRLVDGGEQRRCFTDVKDGVECLFRIIENKNSRASQQIFNIGNPSGEYSMAQLAEILRKTFATHPLRSHFPPDAGIQHVEAQLFYGDGYQDISHRKPSIENAKRLLNWQPQTPFIQSVQETLDFFLYEELRQRSSHNKQ